MTETVSGTPRASGATRRQRGLRLERVYTRPGVHPYDEVTWERRDVVMTNWRDGSINFEQRGSGAGMNLSRIRSSKELLSSGGTASGPVRFMRGADASAGTIKSGGATRRAAKMVILDVDHPDIEEFVETKAREEDKIRALRDAGYDMDLGGKDIVSVQYQNANNSVRVNDEIMRAVEESKELGLKSRHTGDVL